MAIDLENELKDVKRHVDFAETRLSQLEGPFGFIFGQLRDSWPRAPARIGAVGTHATLTHHGCRVPR